MIIPSITNVILLKNMFVLMYVAKIFIMYFFASNVINPRWLQWEKEL